MGIVRAREIPGFNAGVWTERDNGQILTHLVLRRPRSPAPPGKPDIGPLVHLKLNSNDKIVFEEPVWEPQNYHISLEDLRAFRKAGEVVAGLSVVEANGDGHIYYPGVVTFPASGPELGFAERIEVIREFGSGKNTTPIGKNRIIFRPDEEPGSGVKNTHKLFVVQRDGESWRIIGKLDFSGFYIPWAQDKIGTTFAPIKIGRRKWLMLIHGYNYDGIYRYAIGWAIIQENPYKVLAVSPEPLVTPNETQEELHPDKRVVYSCGHRERGNKFDVYINRGDRVTCRETFSL